MSTSCKGNRTTKSIGTTTPTVTAYVYDAANQLKEIRSGSATGALLASLTYDADGNLKSRSDTGLTLGYDPLNRLTQATLGGQTQSYSYDDQGRRIGKTIGTTTTNFLYNDADIVAEYGATWGLPAAQYTHGNKIDDINIRATATTAQYFHQDGLGSVVGVTNNLGATDATQRFDAWGNKLAATGIAPRYGYTGREPDETGLVFYRARYYDPSLGRFTQRDPIGLGGGINRYSYVWGNPLNFTDPDGRCGLPCVIGVIGVGGTVLYKVYPVGRTIYDATNNMLNRPMGDSVLNNPDTAAAAQQGQINGLNDMGNVGGAGADLVYRNPISSATDKIQWVIDKINSIISDKSAPKDGNTVTGSGGYTVGGLPGRLVVPAAPYAGSQQ